MASETQMFGRFTSVVSEAIALHIKQEIAKELYRILALMDNSDRSVLLRGTVSAWGDTASDDDLLAAMREWTAKKIEEYRKTVAYYDEFLRPVSVLNEL